MNLARKIKRHGIGRPKRAKPPKAAPFSGEKLHAVALIRDGELHRQPYRGSHWQIRAALGDPDPTKHVNGDVEGFVTTSGRFVDRAEAQEIAIAAGQIRSLMGREMLSSDITWDPHPQEKP